MFITRRNLFRSLAAGAVTTAIPSMAQQSAGRKVRLESGDRGAVAPIIRLGRNENAYGPSAKVKSAMQEAALRTASRYPADQVEELTNRIAAFHRITPEQVVPGCGSSEILRMAVAAFLEPGKKLIVATPTCEVITGFAPPKAVISVPLAKDYSHDLNGMLSHVDDSAGLLYICNPNNPTGTLTRRKDIEELVRALPSTTFVLIDEAYHHYVSKSADYSSFIDSSLDDNRVIVTRSFSNVYGLAGLRVGYAVAKPATARRLGAYRIPDGVNAIAAKAAIAALDDADHVSASANQNTDDRQAFVNQAAARSVRAIHSHTNFVMINAGRPSDGVIEPFRQNGIALAPPIPSFDQHIRVSLGVPKEMTEFWRVWDLMPTLPGGHGMH